MPTTRFRDGDRASVARESLPAIPRYMDRADPIMVTAQGSSTRRGIGPTMQTGNLRYCKLPSGL